MSYWGTQLKE